MLITEKTITVTNAVVKLDSNEIASLVDVHDIIDCYLLMLNDNDAEQMHSPLTGELIDRDDLRRVMGVISGLTHCREWVLE